MGLAGFSKHGSQKSPLVSLAFTWNPCFETMQKSLKLFILFKPLKFSGMTCVIAKGSTRTASHCGERHWAYDPDEKFPPVTPENGAQSRPLPLPVCKDISYPLLSAKRLASSVHVCKQTAVLTKGSVTRNLPSVPEGYEKLKVGLSSGTFTSSRRGWKKRHASSLEREQKFGWKKKKSCMKW